MQTEYQKENDLAKILADPFFFIKEILGYKDVVGFHREMIEFILSRNDSLILTPRFHFKSSIVSIGLSIWRIIKNPDIRILINNKILKNAKRFLFEIKQHFEHNLLFRDLFGEWKGSVWREDEIVVNKRTKILKEATISIGACDHELTSGHFDFIISDDLAGLSDMVSEASRENTLRFYKSLAYLGDKGTQTCLVGTRWHLQDVYSFIISKFPKKNVMVKKAIQNNGKLLFSERFTMADMKKIQNDDPVFFESQMQNNPTAMSDQLYNLDKLSFYDYDSIRIDHVIGYVDPAFGKKERGEPCFFCFVIACILKEKIYIIEWITNKDKPEQNELLISAKCKQYGIKRLGIESNAAQSEFTRNVKRVLIKDEIKIGIEDINHNENKDRRIQAMHGTVVNNVLFRNDWEAEYSEAMTQMTLYPYSKFKDAPDALEGLVTMAQKPKAGHFGEQKQKQKPITAGMRGTQW